MLRVISAIIISALLLFQSSALSFAAVVTVNKSGDIVWNVLPAHDELGSSPQPDSLTVTSVAQAGYTSEKAEVSLVNNGGKVELSVNDGNGYKQADVSDYKSEVVEIEQRELPKKISILVSGNGFLLKEQSVSAFTDFAITIEPENKRISVSTPTGMQYLDILPSEALGQVIQGQLLDIVDGDYLILSDSTAGQIQYTIHGRKTLDILNIFKYEVPVSANVSAVDGKVLSVEQPVWLPIASFLFT